jgi:hypothetical protein
VGAGFYNLSLGLKDEGEPAPTKSVLIALAVAIVSQFTFIPESAIVIPGYFHIY